MSCLTWVLGAEIESAGEQSRKRELVSNLSSLILRKLTNKAMHLMHCGPCISSCQQLDMVTLSSSNLKVGLSESNLWVNFLLAL